MNLTCTRSSARPGSDSVGLPVARHLPLPALAALLACSSATPGPAIVEPQAGEGGTPLERAAGLLAAAGLERAHVLHPGDVARALEAGLTEELIVGLLDEQFHDCLAAGSSCRDSLTGPDGDAQADTVDRLVRLLGELSGPSSLPFLARFDANGLYLAGMALERALERTWEAERTGQACAPPTPDEVSAARGTLDDFAVLRARDGRLVPEALGDAERDDLAYFLAAVSEADPPIGEGPDGGDDSRTDAAQPTLDLERVRSDLDTARASGDLDAVVRAGMAYLERLGYPGPMRTREQDRHVWTGVRIPVVMRDTALAAEVLGKLDVAAELYRRADPGDGAGGSIKEVNWEQQVRGVIRAEERRGRCRAIVAERLLAVDGLTLGEGAPTYGPAELAAAGFDVLRLYRGALLTSYRDRQQDEVRAVLETAPPPLGGSAVRRLETRGLEAWEYRIRALEGFADSGRRDAVPVLVDLARTGLDEPRLRAVGALGSLAARPLNDPCLPTYVRGHSGSSEWRREITPLGDECATVLSLDEAGQLAAELAPAAETADLELKEAVVTALGAIGSPASLDLLLELAGGSTVEPSGRVCGVSEAGEEEDCRPYYPVLAAAQEAIAHIERLAQTWAEQRERAAAESAERPPDSATHDEPPGS